MLGRNYNNKKESLTLEQFKNCCTFIKKCIPIVECIIKNTTYLNKYLQK